MKEMAKTLSGHRNLELIDIGKYEICVNDHFKSDTK